MARAERSEVAALEELEGSAVTALVSTAAVVTEEELEGTPLVSTATVVTVTEEELEGTPSVTKEATAAVAVVTEEELEGMSSATALPVAKVDPVALYSVHLVFS